MNSAPHLLVEDQPEFERVLDDVLHTADHRPELTVQGPQQLDHEQLRSMALAAAVPIAACAAAEYQDYVALRQELRDLDATEHASPVEAGADAAGLITPTEPATSPTPSTSPPPSVGAAQHHDKAAQLGLAGAMSAGLGDTAGAGVLAMVSVLAPLLAGAAAVIFLLVGYSLQLLTPEPSLAAALRTAGWAFAVLAAATALAGMAGVLLAAVRNSGADPTSPPPSPYPRAELVTAVDEAEDTWRQALLRHGILPFLREAVADPRAALDTFDAGHLVPYEPRRTTRLGYSHPDYSSPAGGTAGSTETTEPEPTDHARTRPRFASPNFSSPDYDGPNYGGPEHRPD